MKQRRLNRTVAGGLVLAVAAWVLPAAAQDGPLPPEDYAPVWTPIFVRVDYTETRLEDPKLAVYAVRVDLEADGLRFVVTPPNGEKPGETDGEFASMFLERMGCQVAINASPFGPVNHEVGGERDISGLCMAAGDVYSKPRDGRDAVLISEDNRVWFAPPPQKTAGAYNAVCGFGMLLEAGKNVGDGGKRHPRTAVGLSEDGRYLYLMAIDGRQYSHSMGATTAETAEWMRALGAHTALNLDGGGSTALVIADAEGKARVKNSPCGGLFSRGERVNGNHLGIYARPLEGAHAEKDPEGAGS